MFIVYFIIAFFYYFIFASHFLSPPPPEGSPSHPDVHPYLLHEGLRPQSVAELEALLAGTPVLACTAMAVHHSVLARRRFDCCGQPPVGSIGEGN